jgi:membrane fusion protein, multidrug efflux system
MKLRDPKFLLPIAVVAAAIVIAVVMVAARPTVEVRTPEVAVPMVRVLEVEPRSLPLTVRTQGTVAPRTESALVPEVGGSVVWVSPALASGGFFQAGEPLVRLDATDYELRVQRAEATLDSAKSQAALATRNHARSRELAGDGLVATTAHEDAEHVAAAASATFREAEASLRQARRDLERTTLFAPYDGRVRDERVDPGQFVERGTNLATLYATDYAEVRLPLPDADLAFLDLALEHRDGTPREAGPPVELVARFAGGEHRWQGRIVRTEGEIDPKSRMVHAVARIDDPYARGASGGTADGRPPLAVGMFVEAEIEGRQIPEAVVLPRAALRGADEVLVVDGEDRLRLRRVNVLRTDGDRVVLSGGLSPGERVCISPLEAVADGMRVEPALERS